MQKERCNLLIKGSFSSGSSAVVDLLREYKNINVFDWEFNDFRAPGLVADQLSLDSSRDYPNRIDEITKIKNFGWRLFFNFMPKKFWEKEWGFPVFKFLKSKNKIKRFNQIHFLKDFNKILKSGISFEEKINHSNEWISRIGNINSINKDYVLFNQPIDTNSDIETWTRVFNPFKLICVYRDPKDQLAELIKRNILFSSFNSPRMTPTGVNILAIYGRDRKGMLKFLIEAFKKRMEDYDRLENLLGPEKILVIDFEGLVNHYNKYKSHIENFLGINESNHILQRKFFNPEVSKNNIGLFSNFLDKDEIKELSGLEEWYLKRLNQQKLEIKVQNLNSEIING